MVTGGVGFTYGSGDSAAYADECRRLSGRRHRRCGPYGPVRRRSGRSRRPTSPRLRPAIPRRRQIVETARCNKCHAALGVFTESAFHAGQRNDANTCAWCHNPNRASSGGWSLDSGVFIHAIHAADKRSVPFNYNASAANPIGFADVGYPGVLQKCETCHLPGTYDFSASASQAPVANRLYRTTATAVQRTRYGCRRHGVSVWAPADAGSARYELWASGAARTW